MIPSSSRWHTALAIVSLLLIGAVVGVTADRLLHRRPTHGGITREEMHGDPMRLLQRELDLRPEQRERVAAIIRARQGTLDSVMLATNRQLRVTIDSVVAEVAAELDPQQAARFHALVEELHPHPSP
jgi:Spy/CpxP family protein refolding chaperone